MNEFEEEVIFNAIKNELKNFRNNNLYRCSCCEKIIEWDDANYNPEEETYTCQKCKHTLNESELEALSIYELIEEMFLAFKEKYDE